MSDKPDYFAIAIGPQGYGKSSLGAELAEARLRAGSWVVAQDMNRECSRFCVERRGTAELLELLAAAAKDQRPIPGGASFAVPADEVLRVAVALGEQWNRAHGTVRQRICVLINEATSFDGAGSTFVGQELARTLNQRRHLGLELVLCMQNAAQLPASVFEAATEVHIFRQDQQKRITLLEDRLGLREGALERLPSLVPHQYVTWRPVVGLV